MVWNKPDINIFGHTGACRYDLLRAAGSIYLPLTLTLVPKGEGNDVIVGFTPFYPPYVYSSLLTMFYPP